MGPGDLSAALAPLPRESDPRLLVGRETFDDAGVFRLSDDLALVQTVDFFAPIVDDPYRFGRIAAANSLSDVYAMGGEPLTAMNIVGFPDKRLPLAVLTEILARRAGRRARGRCAHRRRPHRDRRGAQVRPLGHRTRAPRPHPVERRTRARATCCCSPSRSAPGSSPPQGRRARSRASRTRLLYRTMSALNAKASAAAVELGARCAHRRHGFRPPRPRAAHRACERGHAAHLARATCRCCPARARRSSPGSRPAVPSATPTGSRRVRRLERRRQRRAGAAHRPADLGRAARRAPEARPRRVLWRCAAAVAVGHVASARPARRL